jgi:hypothetical protein
MKTRDMVRESRASRNTLKVALEEKGKFQNEATRVEEAKTTIPARETMLKPVEETMKRLDKQCRRED